jgi:hypothetical protein
MPSNRHAQRDKNRDDLEAQEVHSLHIMNRRQLEILELLHQWQTTQAKGRGTDDGL